MAATPDYRLSSGRRRTSYDRHQGNRRDMGTQEMYIYGNTAPQMEPVPKRRHQPRPRRHRRMYPQQKPVSMPGISFGSFFFLLGAMAVMLTVCFCYLHVQSQITNMKNEAVNLQMEIAQAREENQEAYQEVMDSVDLSEVYEIATKEFGMTQAVDNQIYKYHNKKSDMVRQHGDIPAADD